MRKSLTSRELILIGLLAVIGLVAAYYLLWYTPLTEEKNKALEQLDTLETQLTVAEAKAANLSRMEAELEEAQASGKLPRNIAPYDNKTPLMNELNSILAQTQDFSLSFGAVDTSDKMVKRNVSLSMVCANYDAARAVLESLRDCSYRCMINDLSVTPATQQQQNNNTFANSRNTPPATQNASINSGPVTVAATLVFFEYQQ